MIIFFAGRDSKYVGPNLAAGSPGRTEVTVLKPEGYSKVWLLDGRPAPAADPPAPQFTGSGLMCYKSDEELPDPNPNLGGTRFLKLSKSPARCAPAPALRAPLPLHADLRGRCLPSAFPRRRHVRGVLLRGRDGEPLLRHARLRPVAEVDERRGGVHALPHASSRCAKVGA